MSTLLGVGIAPLGAKDVSHIRFTDNLTLFKGDTLEWDYKRNKVMVVSSAGKVRQVTNYKVESNGQSTTAGSGQNTGVVGQG